MKTWCRIILEKIIKQKKLKGKLVFAPVDDDLIWAWYLCKENNCFYLGTTWQKAAKSLERL